MTTSTSRIVPPSTGAALRADVAENKRFLTPFLWAVFILSAVVACSSSNKPAPTVDAGGDAGAEVDAGDSGSDAGPDAGLDAGLDAGGGADAGADGGILDIVFVIHLEGRDNSPASEFNVYVSQIRNIMLAFEDAGAKLSFETESVVTPSSGGDGLSESLVQGIQLHGDNVLTEAVARGHGVQLHGGLAMGLESSMTEFAADLRTQRALLQDAGINPVSVSNICSAMDWTSAVADAGYLFATSIVEYCAKSLPIGKQSASTIACTTPAACHVPYPTDLNRRLRPWRANGPDWVTPTAVGTPGSLVILPTAHGLSCIFEEMNDGGAATECPIDANDVAAFVSTLNSAIALIQPGVVTALTVVTSFGGHPTTNELPFVRQMLMAANAYVLEGRARFSTTKNVYDAFIAAE